MKFFSLFLFPFLSIAQQESFKLCDSHITEKWKPQYYSFKAKYPLSSEKLTERANKVLVYQPKNIDGFLTIRFMVNCKGQTGHYETYQINNNYQTTVFEQKYVEQLLTFIKNLNNWKIANYQEMAYDYYTYFTFKIEHGVIMEIVP